MKNTPIWMALILLPALSAVIGTANYLGNLTILHAGWYSLWSQHSLFLAFLFMPVLLAAFVSNAWRLEHTGTNWNMLKAYVSPSRILLQKYAPAIFFVFLSFLVITLLYWLGGCYAGLQAPLPKELPQWILFGFIGSISIISVQILLSLVIRNFALPIGIAFAGSIGSLLITAKFNLPYLLPYSLMNIGMRANNPHLKIDSLPFLLACILHIVLWYTLAYLYLTHCDSKTHE